MGCDRVFPGPLISGNAHRKLRVARLISNLLERMPRFETGTLALCKPETIDCFRQMNRYNSTIQFRVHETVAKLAQLSPRILENYTDYLKELVGLFDHRDVMMQLNAIQIFSQVAASSKGIEFLEKQGVLKRMTDLLQRPNDGSIDYMLQAASVLKFFGRMTLGQPGMIRSLDMQYGIVGKFKNAMTSADPELAETGALCIGMVGSSEAGLSYVSDKPGVLNAFFNCTIAPPVLKKFGFNAHWRPCSHSIPLPKYLKNLAVSPSDFMIVFRAHQLHLTTS